MRRRAMMMASLLLFLLLPLVSCRSWSKQERPLVRLVPQQSCYYQQHRRQLTCKCDSTDSRAKLHLPMKYFVFDEGNAIQKVFLESCRELRLSLDLRAVDATDYPVYVRHMLKVTLDEVVFEPRYSDRQELLIDLWNVDSVHVENITIKDSLRLRAANIKEAHLVNSTFAHIPLRGISVSGARILDIRDSTFMRVTQSSIVAENTADVSVIKNEMSVHALEAVHAQDGAHLRVSCNRLVGQPETPECSRMTTTTTTTTTTKPIISVKHELDANQETLRIDEEEDSMLTEILAGALIGLLVAVLLLLLLVVLLLRNRRRRDESEQKERHETDEGVDMDQQEEETKPLSPAKSPVNVEAEEHDEERHVPMVKPIWIEEIQRNKIFNKQKSLLSADDLHKAATAENVGDKIDEEQENKLLDEAKESSRTESDEDTKTDAERRQVTETLC